MRPLLSRAALVAALVLMISSVAGCSRKAERLVGNERLKRGAAGLGTTVDSVVVIDRDTYVVPSGTANFGPTLLAGRTGAFEAHTLLNVRSWTLPDTTLPGFVLDSVRLVLPYDTTLSIPTNKPRVTLSLASTAWTDSSVGWMQPTPGTALGTDTVGVTFPFVLRLPAATLFGMIKDWAQGTTTLDGFVLHPAAGPTGLTAFQAGAGSFRLHYSYTGSDSTERASVDTKITEDLYIYAPATQLATGSDTTIVLGGLYDYRAVLHFVAPTAPPGASINRGFVRMTLRGSPAGSRTLDLRRITGSWLETATDLASVPHESAALLTTVVVPAVAGTDTVIDIPVPARVVRAWQTDPSSNEGLLIGVPRANLYSEILVSAREGSAGAKLFVTTTTPPPGRF